jgi:hypothetical protein
VPRSGPTRPHLKFGRRAGRQRSSPINIGFCTRRYAPAMHRRACAPIENRPCAASFLSAPRAASLEGWRSSRGRSPALEPAAGANAARGGRSSSSSPLSAGSNRLQTARRDAHRPLPRARKVRGLTSGSRKRGKMRAKRNLDAWRRCGGRGRARRRACAISELSRGKFVGQRCRDAKAVVERQSLSRPVGASRVGIARQCAVFWI